MQKRRTNIYTTAILSIVYSLAIGLITLSYIAKDEGTLGDSIVLNLIADYLYILAIPTFILISILANTGLNHIVFFSIGIFASGIFYAYLTIFLYTSFQRNNSPIR